MILVICSKKMCLQSMLICQEDLCVCVDRWLHAPSLLHRSWWVLLGEGPELLFTRLLLWLRSSWAIENLSKTICWFCKFTVYFSLFFLYLWYYLNSFQDCLIRVAARSFWPPRQSGKLLLNVFYRTENKAQERTWFPQSKPCCEGQTEEALSFCLFRVIHFRFPTLVYVSHFIF